jgi:nucleoside-diphosphate-sugar epimerase
MRIVITGAAGYIGSMMCKYLQEDGHQIIAFDSLIWKQGQLIAPIVAHNYVSRFYIEDVTKWSKNLYREIEMADAVIPLAAYVGAPLCDNFPKEATAINETWFETFRKVITDQWVLYPNSNSGYGTVKGVCTEETPMNPISLYGKTKLRAEEIMQDYPNFIGFRLATVFGWSYRPRTDLLVNNLVYQKEVELFDAHAMRNYIHVRDISTAFRFALNQHHRMRMGGQIYNLGNDSINMSKLDLMKEISKITGATYTINEDRTDPDKRDYMVSSQKLYNLGYKPSYDLEFGIRELRGYYQLINDKQFVRSRNY